MLTLFSKKGKAEQRFKHPFLKQKNKYIKEITNLYIHVEPHVCVI